ncbi:MAG TPA: HAMP domain-containing sensor histidine kinase [Gemmatimonadaceae bacterium]|jgi:signal transduction histidine kinase
MSDSAVVTRAGDPDRIQHERMATLGVLAAGLAHELNNPAIAIGRSVDLLRENINSIDPILRQLAGHSWSDEELLFLARLGATTEGAPSITASLDVVDRADREDALGTWLDRHGVAASSELTSALVDRGVTPDELARLAKGCSPAVVGDAMAWLSRLTMIRQLLDDVGRSAARIGELVRAVKSQAYTDTGRRTVDIHESLESSLTLMGYKLREAGAKIIRDYDRALPKVETYGTELHQLWTNLFDNAADALAAKPDGERIVRVRTAQEGDGVRVEISDSGPGIPEELASRIFEAHFTTKAAGKGTGLGLDIVKRIAAHHHGSVTCESNSSGARFVVHIPLAQPPAPTDGASSIG